jgi:hypothetical protein
MTRKPSRRRRRAPPPEAADGDLGSGPGDCPAEEKAGHGLSQTRAQTVVPATELERRRRAKEAAASEIGRALFGDGTA